MYVFGSFVKNKMDVAMWDYFRIFYSVAFVYMPGFVSMLYFFVTMPL
jgi:hypothetical protein